MIKAEIVDSVYEQLGLTRVEAGKIVENIFAVIRDSLKNGENVQIVGFGTFGLRDKRDRMGCNPKTGQKVTIEARRILTFKSSRILKDLVNNGKAD